MNSTNRFAVVSAFVKGARQSRIVDTYEEDIPHNLSVDASYSVAQDALIAATGIWKHSVQQAFLASAQGREYSPLPLKDLQKRYAAYVEQEKEVLQVENADRFDLGEGGYTPSGVPLKRALGLDSGRPDLDPNKLAKEQHSLAQKVRLGEEKFVLHSSAHRSKRGGGSFQGKRNGRADWYDAEYAQTYSSAEKALSAKNKMRIVGRAVPQSYAVQAEAHLKAPPPKAPHSGVTAKKKTVRKPKKKTKAEARADMDREQGIRTTLSGQRIKLSPKKATKKKVSPKKTKAKAWKRSKSGKQYYVTAAGNRVYKKT